MSFSKLAVGLIGLVGSVAGYTLEKDYSGSQFFSGMTFFTSPDPTHGFVQYTSQSEAQSEGLISTNGASVRMSVDANGTASGGRKSVRVSSSQSFSSGLFVVDVGHMPTGCGTWPAFWLVGPNWPNDGEIDIIEGVNTQSTNKMTLHTGAGCQISNSGGMSGSISSTNCDVSNGDNEGCGVQAGSSQSYGAGLNSGGGAVYATEVTSSDISIWFWPQGSAPSDASGSSPNPSGWGTPVAKFTGCDISSHFQQMSIVFDTTFCGDWAGQTWSSDSTCSSQASSCQSYVQSPPQGAFDDAYWSVNSLKVYSGAGSSSSGSSLEAAQQASPSPQSSKGNTGSGGNTESSSSVGQAPVNSPTPTAAPATPAAPTAPAQGQPLQESWFQGHQHQTQGAHQPWRRHLHRHAQRETI